MAYPVPHIITGPITAATGQFLPLAHTVFAASNTTEAQTQKYMTYSGTWSGLSIYVRTANATGTTTFTVRKNGADTGVTVTVPQSTTGLHQDLTNSVSVSPGDLMSIGITTASGGSMNVASVTNLFESDSGDSVHYNMSYDPGTAASGAQPRYYKPNGDYSGAFTTEANNRILIQHDSTLTELSAYVSANARTSASFFRSRINSATGNLAAQAPITTTGLFTDTSTSDALTAGDFLGIRLDWTGGANAITFINIQTTIVSDNPREITMMGGNQAIRNTTNTNDSWTYAGGLNFFSGTGEAAVRAYFITPGAVSGLAYMASGNTSTQNLTFQLRRNGADVNGVLVYTTGSTGWLQDTTNSDAYDNNDYMSTRNYRAAAGSGTTIFQSNSILYTMDEIITFRPIVMMF